MSPSACRTLLALAAVLLLAVGSIWFLAPDFMYGQLGVSDASPVAVYMARRYGAMFFGYSVLLWLARDAAVSPAGRAIAAGVAVVAIVLAGVSAWGAMSGVAGPAIWGAAAIEVVLAAFFVRMWRSA